MKNSLNLLTECSDQIEVLTEETDSGKQLFIEGIFAQAELRNGNGRFYPRSVMEQAVEKYNKEYVKRNRALGELNHPDYPFPDPDKGAIRVVEYRMEGNNVYGKALVLNTPKGQTVRGLLEGGFAMGVSTRGLGTLKERNGMKEVQSDFFKTAVDCVDNPSAPDAYVNSMMESTQWQLNESKGVWVPVMDESASDYINEQLFLERLEEHLKRIKK